jgi:hypothetical protein
VAQFARPDGDQTLGTWEDDGAGTTNIYQAIDEASASDTDYVRNDNNTNDSYEATLSNVTDPTVHTGHVVRYRYRKDQSGGNSRNIAVGLYQGGTLIASQTHNDIGNTWTPGSFTLTTGEAGNISDYTDLRVRATASGTTGGNPGNRRRVELSWAELEVPDVAGQNLVEVVDETVNVADTEATAFKLTRQDVDTSQVGETTAVALAMARAAAGETVNVGETVVTVVETALLELVAETVQVGETVQALVELKRAVGETVQALEGTVTALELRRLVAETVQALEVASAHLAQVRPSAETVQVVEATSYVRGARSVVGETVQAVETTLAVLQSSINKAVAETVQAQESTAALLAQVRPVAEALSALETTVVALGLVRGPAETVELQEAALAALAATRLAGETVQVGETTVAVVTAGAASLVEIAAEVLEVREAALAVLGAGGALEIVVSGKVLEPDGSAADGGWVEIELEGVAIVWDGLNYHVALPGPVRAPIAADGSVSFTLWATDELAGVEAYRLRYETRRGTSWTQRTAPTSVQFPAGAAAVGDLPTL